MFMVKHEHDTPDRGDHACAQPTQDNYEAPNVPATFTQPPFRPPLYTHPMELTT